MRPIKRQSPEGSPNRENSRLPRVELDLNKPARRPDQPGKEKVLAVIGAGPKGVAIAVKLEALRQAGFSVPRLVVIDRQGVAANWSGGHGYTDGQMPLSTPPEKDLGFPYPANWGKRSAEVNALMREFSWHSHLINKGLYSDWVDRRAPRPRHRQWSKYISWGLKQTPTRPLLAEVRSIGLAGAGERWLLSCESAGGGKTSVECDGLVITGTGTPLRVSGQPEDHPRVFDGRTFWLHTKELSHVPGPVHVCLIGTGETAASIAVALLGILKPGSSVEVVTPQGVLYSRGESFWENRLYSNPYPEWQTLAESHRREFLKRTDRGVFSLQAESVLNEAEGLRTLAGRVTRIEPHPYEVVVNIEYEQQREKAAYDYIVVAVGFDPLWFNSRLTPEARERITAVADAVDALEDASRSPSSTLSFMAVERRIGFDLSVDGLVPALHLPMMAGLAQGPGFPNLSCLGLLSDRILGPYVPPGPEDGTMPLGLDRGWTWSAGHERPHDFTNIGGGDTGSAEHKEWLEVRG
jgi:mycobactin lysine-N-oxygenase